MAACCGSPHPVYGHILCLAPDGPHADHINGTTFWDNTEFVPTPRPASRRGRVPPTDPLGLARTGDPSTSHEGAKSVVMRSGSQKMRLLAVYGQSEDGLTDEEAAQGADLFSIPGCCWWHRCSDLREMQAIVPTGQTRIASTGEERMVCEITEFGRSYL